MRVLVLNFFFPPVGGGTALRNLRFAERLPGLGWDPIVVTGTGADHFWAPAAERETDGHAGPAVLRVPGPEPGASTGLRRRGERLLGRRAEWYRWWIRGALATARTVCADVDLIYAALEPYETAIVASELSREFGKPWIAELADPWALDEMRMHVSRLHRAADTRLMRRTLGTAAAVIMNTPEARKRAALAFPEIESRLVDPIALGYEAADFVAPLSQRTDDVFRIVHTGFLHTELGRRHRRTGWLRRLTGGLYAPIDVLPRSHLFLLEAVQGVLEQDPARRDEVEVHLVGGLTDTDRAIAERYPFTRLHGYVAHEESVAIMRSADLLFLPMHELPVGIRAGLVPGKTYEYLASGTPILAAVPEGDARDLLAETGQSYLCRPSDTTGLARAVEDALAKWRAGTPREAPPAELVERYERGKLTRDLAAVFDAVLRGGDERVGRRRPGPTIRAVRPGKAARSSRSCPEGAHLASQRARENVVRRAPPPPAGGKPGRRNGRADAAATDTEGSTIMDLQLYYDVVRRHRVVLGAGLGLAILLAFFSVVTFQGGGLAYRQQLEWGTHEVLLVTQPGFPAGRSILPQPVEGANGRQQSTNRPVFADPTRFTDLAALYSRFVTTDPVRQLILGSHPIRGGESIQAQPLVDNATNNALPMVDIYAVATSPAASVTLAQRAGAALQAYILEQQNQNNVPGSARVELSVIEKAGDARTLADQRTKPQVLKKRSFTRPIVVFLGIVLLSILAALVLENLRAPAPEAAGSADEAGEPDIDDADSGERGHDDMTVDDQDAAPVAEAETEDAGPEDGADELDDEAETEPQTPMHVVSESDDDDAVMTVEDQDAAPVAEAETDDAGPEDGADELDDEAETDEPQTPMHAVSESDDELAVTRESRSSSAA